MVYTWGNTLFLHMLRQPLLSLAVNQNFLKTPTSKHMNRNFLEVIGLPYPQAKYKVERDDISTDLHVLPCFTNRMSFFFSFFVTKNGRSLGTKYFRAMEVVAPYFICLHL